MRCPFCNDSDTHVKDSRPTEDSAAIRRRRHCLSCGGRFTTFERIQLRDLIVVKNNGRREPLNRDKLANSMNVALRKCGVPQERVEKAISAIVRQLENEGKSEVPTVAIGNKVIEALRHLDDVAYIRFASVYRNFREVEDFEKIIGELEEPHE